LRELTSRIEYPIADRKLFAVSYGGDKMLKEKDVAFSL